MDEHLSFIHTISTQSLLGRTCACGRCCTNFQDGGRAGRWVLGVWCFNLFQYIHVANRICTERRLQQNITYVHLSFWVRTDCKKWWAKKLGRKIFYGRHMNVERRFNDELLINNSELSPSPTTCAFLDHVCLSYERTSGLPGNVLTHNVLPPPEHIYLQMPSLLPPSEGSIFFVKPGICSLQSRGIGKCRKWLVHIVLDCPYHSMITGQFPRTPGMAKAASTYSPHPRLRPRVSSLSCLYSLLNFQAMQQFCFVSFPHWVFSPLQEMSHFDIAFQIFFSDGSPCDDLEKKTDWFWLSILSLAWTITSEAACSSYKSALQLAENAHTNVHAMPCDQRTVGNCSRCLRADGVVLFVPFIRAVRGTILGLFSLI